MMRHHMKHMKGSGNEEGKISLPAALFLFLCVIVGIGCIGIFTQ